MQLQESKNDVGVEPRAFLMENFNESYNKDVKSVGQKSVRMVTDDGIFLYYPNKNHLRLWSFFHRFIDTIICYKAYLIRYDKSTSEFSMGGF